MRATRACPCPYEYVLAVTVLNVCDHSIIHALCLRSRARAYRRSVSTAVVNMLPATKPCLCRRNHHASGFSGSGWSITSAGISAVHVLVQGWRGAGAGAGIGAPSSAACRSCLPARYSRARWCCCSLAGYERCERSLPRSRCFSCCLRLCCIIVQYAASSMSGNSLRLKRFFVLLPGGEDAAPTIVKVSPCPAAPEAASAGAEPLCTAAVAASTIASICAAQRHTPTTKRKDANAGCNAGRALPPGRTTGLISVDEYVL